MDVILGGRYDVWKRANNRVDFFLSDWVTNRIDISYEVVCDFM